MRTTKCNCVLPYLNVILSLLKAVGDGTDSITGEVQLHNGQTSLATNLKFHPACAHLQIAARYLGLMPHV